MKQYNMQEFPCEIPSNRLSIALVGNPNCGKTTLFNALTGARQRVGNWPGVTVERKSGYTTEGGKILEIVDLPGIYSISEASETSAIDERIACDFILDGKTDGVINIVDASNLERHLYLTLQLLEMKVPLVLVLNMMDVAKNKQIHIDIAALSQLLGCPVISLSANKKTGLRALKQSLLNIKLGLGNHLNDGTQQHDTNIKQQSNQEQNFPLNIYPLIIKNAVIKLTHFIVQHPKLSIAQKISPAWLAICLLEGNGFANDKVTPASHQQAQIIRAEIEKDGQDEVDILLADARYQGINHILTQCLSQSASPKRAWTTLIDNVVLNRVLGIPIFLGIMYLLFVFAINIGGAFQDFFDISSQTLFVDGPAHWLTALGAPMWLTVLLANGIGKGINTTITFIPVIGAMFLFLAFLEDSGYMARAAFVIDRFMCALGLPGKAFVPMIVGFGCNVPGVMAARTLENKRDRILTIMMSPFMSCGARLAIFAVFTAAFFPRGGQNIVFALYLIGILMAVLTGFLLRKTLLKGEASPLVMELPLYHLPRVGTLMLHAWHRLKSFVLRAGKLIVPICVLIGVLNTLNLDGTMNTGDGDSHSLLSTIGRLATPIFTPMGLEADNWPATVGLVTGILAKEVVVGTLNALYTQVGHLAAAADATTFSVLGGLQTALRSIPDNLLALRHAFSNPILAKAPINAVNQGVYGLMYEKFDGQIGAFAYLLFVLLYFPCVSTTAAMLREVHRGWSLFSVIWMTGVAYGAAVLFYQIATWPRHPFASLVWVSAILFVFIATITGIHYYADSEMTMKKSKHNVGELT